MLRLKLADLEDAEFIYSAQRLPHIQTYVGGQTLEEIEETMKCPNQNFFLGLTSQDDEIGFIHLRGLSTEDLSVEIYRLGIVKPNHGFGREFLNLILSSLFAQEYHRIWLDVFLQNEAARKLYNKCGMIEEGVLRDAYRWNGAFQSTIVMSILQHEWDVQ